MLFVFRISSFLFRLNVPILPHVFYIFNRIVFGIVLPPSVILGKGVVFAYQGIAVVVHKRAQIGDDVYIGPQVVIGGRGSHFGVPVIGRGVQLGAGCKLLGPISIGDFAVVGAGAVVLSDVKSKAVVVGCPAVPIGGSNQCE